MLQAEVDLGILVHVFLLVQAGFEVHVPLLFKPNKMLIWDHCMANNRWKVILIKSDAIEVQAAGDRCAQLHKLIDLLIIFKSIFKID